MSDREILLDEERALRNLLLGITVDDQKNDEQAGNGRRVGVWYGQPDVEIRNQSFPFITIDFIDISEAKERAHRGMSSPVYDRPEGAGEEWQTDFPIPLNLDYQITTWARQPRHDRQIMAGLLNNRIPLRFGVLTPDDGTVRRLDVLDVSKRDTTENGKRLFKNAITVRVSSEMPPANTVVYEQVINRFLTFGLKIPALPPVTP